MCDASGSCSAFIAVDITYCRSEAFQGFLETCRAHTVHPNISAVWRQAATKHETKLLFQSLSQNMTFAEYEKLPPEEKEHFFQCPKCGEFVDKRELRDVIFHVTRHKPKPENPRIKPLGSDDVSCV